MKKMICLLFFFGLSGCMVGPDYRRPPIDTPASFYYETKEAKDTLNLQWWHQFDDPVLEELIAEALENNNDIKMAAANVMNALGIMIQTRAPLFPQVGYSGVFSRTRSSEVLAPATGVPFAFDNPSSLWQAFVNGSFDIDLWGRTRRLVEASVANIYAAYEARQGVILSVVTTVADLYIKLIGLDEQLSISLKTLKSYGDAVNYFQIQFKYGQESEMAVAQAKTQYEIAAAKIPQIKRQIVQTENALSVLLGKNPGMIPRGRTLYTLRLPEIPCDLPSSLLNQRPDIMQAEDNLIAANAEIGAAIALYFPSISLTGYYGGASQQLHQLFTGPAKSWNYTGSITGPIFTAGAIYGQVVQAKAQREAALYNYRQTIIEAFADVENALSSHTMLQEELQAQEKLVQAAGQYQSLALLQYKGGYAPYFMVIQAQEQYFPAELSWAQVKAQVFSSIVNIYQAMGGGWVNIADEMTKAPCQN